jgi:FkbM family methyltransferase
MITADLFLPQDNMEWSEITTQYLSGLVGGINGVFHAGSYDGEEIEDYAKCGINTVVWAEANYRVFNKLIKRTSPYGRNQHWYCHCLSDVDNQINVFNLSNNGESSSTLEFGKDHKELMSHIVYTDKTYLLTKRVDTLVKEQSDFNWNDISYLVTDCQGCDLKVLKGCGSLLASPNLKIIKTEVDVKEMYHGGSTEKDLGEYLSQFGFGLQFWFNANGGWGERYWFRQ